MSNLITKVELVEELKNAKSEVKILSVVAFDIDWDEVRDIWFEKINEGSLSVEIILESEEEAYKRSIIASNKRYSGENRSYELGSFLNILHAPSLDLRKYLLDRQCKYMEPIEDIKGNEINGYKQRFSLRTCYLEIPYPIVKIDEEYYTCYLFTKFNDIGQFERITKEHPWYEGFQKYIDAYLSEPANGGKIRQNVAKKFSTEETKKGNRMEVIYLYNNERVIMGSLPRDSFMDTSYIKNVVWALIFTRDGRLLIHQRSKNAKDNQGMWDKSVGGHVSADDIDTVKATARELAEELYSVEEEEQGGHGESSYFQVNVDKMKFLGEWSPDTRYMLPFNEVDNQKDETYFFRMNYAFSNIVINSPRHLPNGDIRDVYTFTDVYVCVVGSQFENKMADLKNSKYKLIELYELKDAMLEGEIEVTKENGEIEYEEFKVSPDLRTIIRSELWQDLTQFSDYLKKYYKRR